MKEKSKLLVVARLRCRMETNCFSLFPDFSMSSQLPTLDRQSANEQLVIDLAEAKANYVTQDSGEMALSTGQKVEILQKAESGWWLARSASDAAIFGWVPSNFLTQLVCDDVVLTVQGYSMP